MQSNDREPRRELDRFVQIPGAKERESAELFLGLGKRPVGHRQLAVALAQRRGRVNGLEACGKDVTAALLELGFEANEIEGLKVFKGAGCKICNGSGYKGRVGLYEVMEITSEIKEAIIMNVTSVELKKVAVANSMITLRRSGLLKVRDQVTTLEEVVRETVH